MPRPLSVTIAALLVLLGSVLTLGFAVLIFGLRHEPDVAAGGGPGLVLAIVGFIAACGAAGIATGVGLLKLKQWARISMVVFSTVLVFIGAFSLLLILAVDLPMPPDVDPEKLALVRPILIGVYLVPTAIGTWWLVLFTRPRVIATFSGGVQAAEAAMPTAVLVVAWLTLFGGIATVVMPFLDVPAFFLGVMFSGWASTVFYAGFAALQLYIGRGLLRLDERARVLAIWFYLLGTLNGLMLLLLPSVRARAAALAGELGMVTGEASPFVPDVMLVWSAGLIVVAVLVQTWLLIRWKHVFTRS